MLRDLVTYHRTRLEELGGAFMNPIWRALSLSWPPWPLATMEGIVSSTKSLRQR